MGSKDGSRQRKTSLTSTRAGAESQAAASSEPDIETEQSSQRKQSSSTRSDGADSSEEDPPPLPPRPDASISTHSTPTSRQSVLQVPARSGRPSLQSGATTALSLTDIHTQSFPDGGRETFASSVHSSSTRRSIGQESHAEGHPSQASSEVDDGASVFSTLPRTAAISDAESILGDVLGSDRPSPAWAPRPSESSSSGLAQFPELKQELQLVGFEHEFDEIETRSPDEANETGLHEAWQSKYKHFLILSSAGKPIYVRHGNDNIVSSYLGVIQTIISFYEGADDQLRSFASHGTRCVILSHSSLYLVAVSKLEETESQLRNQLEALYMQILSTLTLPNLEHMLVKRPSADLRRPLQGTEALLSALADSFTRGSPSTLLASVECLKLRLRHRQAINNAMLQTRSKQLLYGLIVAGGRLVSVIRPRTHSLHPGDLQLIFNMLFQAHGVKASEGENWIPMCLPGFNKNGFLYMYVSFVDCVEEAARPQIRRDLAMEEGRLAIILISADKEAFYDLRGMRDELVEELESQKLLKVIRASLLTNPVAVTSIVPGTVIQHFLYKSRTNLQYIAPSFQPIFSETLARRRLMSKYHTLHASVHAKVAPTTVLHSVSADFASLAWATSAFELYCVADPAAHRNAMAQNATKIVEWVRREEARLFIVGGAVF